MGSGYGRGLEFLMQQRAKTGGAGDGVRKMYLTADGAIARFRYLTDAPDIFAHNFHEVEVQGARRTFTKDVLCLRKVGAEGEPTDPPEACEFCSRETPLAAWWKGISWVWVYRMWAPTKLSDRYTKRAKHGEVLGYIEEVAEARLLILKRSISELTNTMFSTYGTLTDRDYNLVRNGRSGSQFYSLVPLDKSTAPAEVQAALKGLPDLTETVLTEFVLQRPARVEAGVEEEVESFDGATAPAAEPTAAAETPTTASEDDGEVVTF